MVKRVKKKILLIGILIFLAFSLVTKGVFAYYGSRDIREWEGAVYKTTDFNIYSHTNETVYGTAVAGVEAIIGPIDPELRAEIGGGAASDIGNLIGSLYSHQPASSVEYLADLGRRLNIITPVYAQEKTIAFRGLGAILSLWKAFRNIAYLFFTVIFVVIGFAIMFRVKLNPQTVITIQNAIPRIVLALILVTFSYAIAGLLIDLIYVLTGVGISLLATTGLPNEEVWNFVNQANPFTAINLLLGGDISGFLETLVVVFALPAALGATIGAVIGAILGAGVGAIGGFFLGLVSGPAIIVLIFAIVITWALLKLFFALLKTYVTIILSIIFAPLQIMLGAFPGGTGFGSWFRNLLANILVFPAVALFFVIGMIITASAEPIRWVPPMLGFGGEIISGIIQMLIGLGMILLAPKVVDMVKEAFQLKPFPYGTAIFAPIGGAVGAVTYIPRRAGRLVTAGIEDRAVKAISGLSAQDVSQGFGSVARAFWKRFKEGQPPPPSSG